MHVGGPDVAKQIHQRHFVRAMEDVVGAKAVMRQSLFTESAPTADDQIVRAIQAAEARWRGTALLAVALAGAALVAAAAALGAVVF